MIERLKDLDEKDFKEMYLKLLNSLESDDEQLLMNYFGAVSDDLVHSLGHALEDLLISYSISKKQINKLFSILVEGLKNIVLYGEQTPFNEKIGFVIVLKTATCFKVLFGNPISDKVQPVLADYLRSISLLNEEELKNKYLETLESTFVNDVRTSGVGLLVMAMKSDFGLNYHFNQLDNQRFIFTTEVKINKIVNK
jgi:hypothetical protein